MPVRRVGTVWGALFALVTLAALGAPRPGPGQEPAPSADQILARVKTTYAQARSYRDTGTVVTVLIKDKAKQTVTQPFATAFVRPNKFRFEFLTDPDTREIQQRFSVWTETGLDKAHRWWTLRPQDETGRLDLWLAGANGLSGGASLAVPALLLPGLTKLPTLIDRKQPQRTGSETINGVVCHVIQETGTHPEGDEAVTLWIGQTRFPRAAGPQARASSARSPPRPRPRSSPGSTSPSRTRRSASRRPAREAAPSSRQRTLRLSSKKVTGPSLTSSTSMWARKTPVATGRPAEARRATKRR